MQPTRGFVALLLLVSLPLLTSGFYVLPGAYQRYLEESRAMFRPSAPLPQLSSFLPPPLALDQDDTPHPTALVPRRRLRQPLDVPHEEKRMRPCFYSPIQCMLRKRADTDQRDVDLSRN